MREAAGLGLVAEQFELFRRRADEDDARYRDPPREFGVFRQKAVAGMNGLGSGLAGSRQYFIDRQIGRRPLTGQFASLAGGAQMRGRGIISGKDRNRRDLEFGGGARDPQRNLAAVGDQELLERHLFSGNFASRQGGRPFWLRYLPQSYGQSPGVSIY
jgi:hypothetical protein